MPAVSSVSDVTQEFGLAAEPPARRAERESHISRAAGRDVVHADGQESDKSREARIFGAWLERVVGLPVVFWDERFTTALAEDALLAARLTNKKRRDRRDRVAAQMILQTFIDAGSPPEGTQPLPPS